MATRPAGDVTTLRAVTRVLAGSASGRVLAGGVLLGTAARLRLGRPGPADAVAIAAVTAAHPFVEWAVHRHVLHAPVRTVAGRRVDLAPGHRTHHARPDDLATATLPGRAAVLDLGLLTGAAAGVALAARRPSVAPTAAAAAAGSLLAYEWVHLLLHAGRRPRTAWLRAMRAHHRLHHHRNEHRWFGVTTRTADRLFGTWPADAASVPRSASVRSLDTMGDAAR